MADPVLSRGELNRALLARQHLLDRADVTTVAMVDHLVGLQAQNAWSPYVGLWSRLRTFRHTDLGDGLADRRLARIAVMRGTIHLVTAVDALLLPALTAPLFRKDLQVNSTHGPALRAVDVEEVAALARTLVEERPRTPAELGAALAHRWPGVPPASLAHAARGTLPLVQVPPRGVWGRSGATRWTTSQAWLGTGDAPPGDLERLVLRYLAAFGPASVADVQAWSGLGGLGDVVERLGDRLVRFTGEPTGPRGRPRPLYDLPDAPRPPADVPAPVRFLPDYDNVLIGHADRTRVVSDERRRALLTSNGAVPGTVLLDGRVAGTWRVHRSPLGDARPRHELATLVVTMLDPTTPGTRRALVTEAEQAVRFVADDAAEHTVRVG